MGHPWEGSKVLKNNSAVGRRPGINEPKKTNGFGGGVVWTTPLEDFKKNQKL